MNTLIKYLTLLLAAVGSIPSQACTSLIASGKATASGRPLLWKNRDTGAATNFLHRVDEPGRIGYVGLFNGADSLDISEAWMGMNDCGFAIMNTVAYNLPANNPDWIDREGYVMAQALQTCRTVDDFEQMLKDMPKPMGVRTNFGVIDATGAGAYFETDDYKYVRYNVEDTANGVMIRTNYAYSGTPDAGMGYIRHGNVEHLLRSQIATGSLTPASLTEGVSRSFYNSQLGIDYGDGDDAWIVDLDFVPRHSTTASIVVEGLLPGETPDRQVMWANIAYPPCAQVVAVTLDNVPADVDATAADGSARAPMSLRAAELKSKVFPLVRGNGQKYINMEALRPINEQNYLRSLEAYSLFRGKMPK